MSNIAWAPNAEKDDLKLAFKLLFSAWKWLGDKDVRKLENELSEYVGVKLSAFDSGRSALYKILELLNIGFGDEVLLQSFTCVALPNPILWRGAKPVYVDVDLSNFNIDIDDLKKKITPRSKAVIVQYTFGICPDITEIKKICKDHNLFLIEDCCHNLGQDITINNQKFKAGTIGDASIFSLGMEKIISATRGGFGWIKDQNLNSKLHIESLKLPKPRGREIIRGLVNPLVWKAKENWGKLGNWIYKIAVKLKIHELGLTRLELIGQKATWLPYQMPNTNALLGLNQLKKIDRFNEHRKEIAKFYIDKLSTNLGNIEKESVNGYYFPNPDNFDKYAKAVFLRFPILVDNANEFREKAESKGITLGNWYTEVIHCKDVDMKCMLYNHGQCPKAEWLTSKMVNLPTHIGIREEQAQEIVELFYF